MSDDDAGSAARPKTQKTKQRRRPNGSRRTARERRPHKLLTDRGHDHDCYRGRLRVRGIRPQIARRGTPHGFRRLLVRYERRADMHEAFLELACCLISFRRLRASL